jgi:hypothetical protein
MRDDDRVLGAIREAEVEHLVVCCTTSNAGRDRDTTSGARDVLAVRRMRWEMLDLQAEAMYVGALMTKPAKRACLIAGGRRAMDKIWAFRCKKGDMGHTLVALRECFRTKRP